MKLEKKLELLKIAYSAIQELSKIPNRTNEEAFVIDASQQIFNSIDELLAIYNKIVTSTESGCLKKIVMHIVQGKEQEINVDVTPSFVIKEDTEVQDAIIGVGSAIIHNQHNQQLELEKMSEQLEHLQVEEFNEMMAGIDF